MRLRRWVVYRMDALPEPDDLVHKEGVYFMKASAERVRVRLGPNLNQWMAMRLVAREGRPVYWTVSKRPQKLFGWRTRRWLRSRSHH